VAFALSRELFYRARRGAEPDAISARLDADRTKVLAELREAST